MTPMVIKKSKTKNPHNLCLYLANRPSFTGNNGIPDFFFICFPCYKFCERYHLLFSSVFVPDETWKVLSWLQICWNEHKATWRDCGTIPSVKMMPVLPPENGNGWKHEFRKECQGVASGLTPWDFWKWQQVSVSVKAMEIMLIFRAHT